MRRLCTNTDGVDELTTSRRRRMVAEPKTGVVRNASPSRTTSQFEKLADEKVGKSEQQRKEAPIFVVQVQAKLAMAAEDKAELERKMLWLEHEKSKLERKNSFLEDKVSTLLGKIHQIRRVVGYREVSESVPVAGASDGVQTRSMVSRTLANSDGYSVGATQKFQDLVGRLLTVCNAHRERSSGNASVLLGPGVAKKADEGVSDAGALYRGTATATATTQPPVRNARRTFNVNRVEMECGPRVF